LGHSQSVTRCPLFLEFMEGGASFENGTGGYGYNATYIGGTPADPFAPERPSKAHRLATTVMFTTAAFAKGNGLQEYPYSEPFQWVDPNGNLQGSLQPSVHFRFRERALVAWCDGRVSMEKPSTFGTTNYYGGNNEEASTGWFGPSEENGYWNPRRSYGNTPQAPSP
ncbi:MAG: hypothetical protein AAF514_24380, partial [Verrucomicrobiota bacterium]